MGLCILLLIRPLPETSLCCTDIMGRWFWCVVHNA